MRLYAVRRVKEVPIPCTSAEMGFTLNAMSYVNACLSFTLYLYSKRECRYEVSIIQLIMLNTSKRDTFYKRSFFIKRACQKEVS